MKFRTGGQTGVDRAVLDCCLESGLEVAGWCPERRLAEDGVIDVKYPMVELAGGDYAARTKANVRDSDATIIIYWGTVEGGTQYTLECCLELGRPHLLIDLESTDLDTAKKRINAFLDQTECTELNIAGPRASDWAGGYECTRSLFSKSFNSCEAIRGIWEGRYARVDLERHKNRGSWLERWGHDLEHGEAKFALDLGCGPGFETRWLIKQGYRVTAMDFSAEALALCAELNPQATLLRNDLSKDLPIEKGKFDVVVASLSLHYFERSRTRQIIESIRSGMSPTGKFFFRVNSYQDVEHGAKGEANDLWDLVYVDGVPKQFFTRKKVEDLLRGVFAIDHLEHLSIKRSGRIKVFYECVASPV
jgi:SAM-dependent methyltransferase